MEAFIIDWNQGKNGTLFASVGLVITYTDQDNIDDKVVNGKIYGVLKSYQVESLQHLIEDAEKDTSQDTHITRYTHHKIHTLVMSSTITILMKLS